MRYIWIIFGGLLIAMLAVLPRLGRRAAAPVTSSIPARQTAYSAGGLAPAGHPDLARADSIAAFGLAQRGTPYVWAGTSPLTGFDCSGFIMYTFAHFGVPTPHSTALLIGVGRPVARAEAQPGDIVVFTGTDPASTIPGHAGIVVSRRDELPLRFVHASSSRREPFVKVNQVEGSDYERRFMQVRRVLGPGTGVATTARTKAPPAAPKRPAEPVAPLTVRPVEVAAKTGPAALLPQVLPKRLTPRRVAARKPAATHKAASRVATKRRAPAKPLGKSAAKPATKARAATPKKNVPNKKLAPARR